MLGPWFLIYILYYYMVKVKTRGAPLCCANWANWLCGLGGPLPRRLWRWLDPTHSHSSSKARCSGSIPVTSQWEPSYYGLMGGHRSFLKRWRAPLARTAWLVFGLKAANIVWKCVRELMGECVWSLSSAFAPKLSDTITVIRTWDVPLPPTDEVSVCWASVSKTQSHEDALVKCSKIQVLPKKKKN